MEPFVLGSVDNSANEPLSLWERGWGEGSNQLRNRNFDSSIILLTPSPPSPGPHAKCVRILHGYPPAAGFALQERGMSQLSTAPRKNAA